MQDHHRTVPPIVEPLLGVAVAGFTLAFCRLSPASKSTKAWIIFYLLCLAVSFFNPRTVAAAAVFVKDYAVRYPVKSAAIFLSIAIPLKYLQRKLRFARINAIKHKFGYTDDPKSWADMTVEQAQEIEANMAETSTDPGVSRAIGNSGHFINEDKRIEHQRMQATIHLMTGLVAYKIKSRNHSLVISRINEHHHRYGIKINSDDVLYLFIHFGLAPVSWINRFGYRKLESFEVHAIWVLWREVGCRMGLKYIPRDLDQALEWKKNFEKTFRWREDANEVMALAMLNQVLYPIPGPLKSFVAQVFVSIVDWDIVYFCQLEKLGPSPWIREIVYDLFRFCGFMVREFGLPRLGPYERSPQEAKKDGRMVFPHTPYDTMPWWQEQSFWNLWGPRALLRRLRGLPLPSSEYQSEGVPFEAMGAPHKHPVTQSSIERRVRENAAVLERAPFGYRPAIGFQANRLLGPVDGPEYGDDMNTFPKGTPTTPNSPERFTRKYERRGEGPKPLGALEDAKLSDEKLPGPPAISKPLPNGLESTPTISVAA